MGGAPIEASRDTCLQQAVAECLGENEEEGGIILSKGFRYEFIKLRNVHTGTPTAVCLFEVDPQEYGDKILPKILEDGFKSFGSFHTHPTGCRALPSTTDLNKLFKGFANNFIWSPSTGEFNWFVFSHVDPDGRYHWKMWNLL